MDELAAAASAAAAAIPAAAAAESKYGRTSELQRWSVIVKHRQGMKAAKIAREENMHANTARAIIKRWKNSGAPASGSRSGRPRATTEEQDEEIVASARATPFTSPKKIARKLELSVSPRTVDRRLVEEGLFGRVSRKGRDYSEAELQQRLRFAEGYRNWTVAEWCNVIFSDEKTWYGEGWCGQVWVRRPVGEALNPEYTTHSVAHPVKIGMWGCFSYAGPGYIHLYNETMDAALQKKVLDENLIATADEHKLSGKQWYFLHDNAPTFKADKVQKWLFNNGITCMEFPPYSPDLNPIENLWSWLSARLDRLDVDTFEKLQDKLADQWEAMRKDEEAIQMMQSLVASMPRRCQAVIDAKGWHTKY